LTISLLDVIGYLTYTLHTRHRGTPWYRSVSLELGRLGDLAVGKGWAMAADVRTGLASSSSDCVSLSIHWIE